MISLIIFKANVMVKENLIKQDQTEFLINTSVKDFNSDTKIYRYIDFDSFLQILDGKFYVATKKQFSDCYDAGKEIPKLFDGMWRKTNKPQAIYYLGTS